GKTRPVSLDSIPVSIDLRRSNPESECPPYHLLLGSDSYILKNDSDQFKGVYGMPLLFRGDTVVMQKREPFMISPGGHYQFEYCKRSAAIVKYIQSLNITPNPKGGPGVLRIEVKDEIPVRAMLSIVDLVQSYDVVNLDYNNQALLKEMSFLEQRLATAGKELEEQEKMVSDFKAGNKVYDMPSSANQVLGELPQIDSKKNENKFKKDLLNLIETNINTPSQSDKTEVIPNVTSIGDATLTELVNKYNQLITQKATVLEKGAELDPRLPVLNVQIDGLKSNIKKTIDNIRDVISLTDQSLAKQEQVATAKFSQIPNKDKQLIEINRILAIKESLYTFLLQKKEENSLQLASTQIAKSRIIDDGLGGVKQIPAPLMIYGGAFGAAIALPALIIILVMLTHKKIETRQDIESSSKIFIAGEISDIRKKKYEIIVRPENVLPEAEQFRTLRTNISHLSIHHKYKTLLITSSKSGEGKSFISLNLATTFAIGNKKVVLVEFDLRNPSLSIKLGLENTLGVADFLDGRNNIEDVIHQLDYSPNLFFISCGYPLPPNPGELIFSHRINELFDYLKANFDMVIIDTPPVGPVSDALVLGRWADLSFFVVRQKHTLISTLKLINKLRETNKLPNLTLIMNGITDTREFNYGNDYGYGYGYQPKKMRRD
ncbi:MAG TPA: polysaccharide biosynthesis tyrosine autokinase, partial [Chitinophagaceae bacterium]|nr:polysaccharide biosynthesis tyrosine autokinase [Chitinophagaceae bacterium]